jgi:hypothetical protein
MSQPLKLRNLNKVVARGFSQAEADVRSEVRGACPMVDEREITFLFQIKLFHALNKVGESMSLAEALISDLGEARVSNLDQRRVAASGLIAEVTWHTPKTEGKTGADLGLVMTMPIIRPNGFGGASLAEGGRSGLLVQAKKKPCDRPWGPVKSRQQQEALSKSLGYTSLLLYRMLDPDNRELDQFGWVPCKSAKMPEVCRWLQSDSFPQSYSTEETIELLGNGEIGTSDPNVIDQQIAPAGQRILQVRIGWRDGVPPSASLTAVSKFRSEEKVKQCRVQQR